MPEKLFGTDGIRGTANEGQLTPENIVRIGKAIAQHFKDQNHGFKKIVIGKDTRLSGYMLETALTSGIVSMGVDVLLVGPLPTPAIAHLTRSLNADAGIVLSASHNPAKDNGIKIFDSKGLKLSEKDEKNIERIFSSNTYSKNTHGIGKATRIDDARGRYIEFVKASISNDSLEGLFVVVDCANGAAYSMAENIFSELGAKVICVNNKPNGLNINLDCGAMHPNTIMRLVKKSGADVGIAFDGDADRVVFCDEKGQLVHGDQSIGLFALDLKKNGSLKNNSIVITHLSNKGLIEFLKSQEINVIISEIGDKNVVEAMKKNNISFGAEQSGHIVFSNTSTTGDGLIAALQLLKILKSSTKKLSELKKSIKLYPQEQESIKVKEKKPFESIKSVQQEIIKAQNLLAGTGRVLVRYSGTEKKARVMVESQSKKTAKDLTRKIALAIKKEIGEKA